MREYRTLGDACGATGVLKERDIVVIALNVHPGQIARIGHHLLKADRLRQLVRADQLLDMLDHQVQQ